VQIRLPFKKGCDYCTRGVKEGGITGLRILKDNSRRTLANLQGKWDLERITISGGGDPSCYPRFGELIELLGQLEAPFTLDTQAVKAGTIRLLQICSLDNGLFLNLSFTVFATDPALRSATCTIPTPEVSLAISTDCAKSVDVYAAAVIPAGNQWWRGAWTNLRMASGSRSKRDNPLMRFANSTEQGLILAMSINHQSKSPTVESFRDLIWIWIRGFL